MIRSSDAFNIRKKDVGNLVTKKRYLDLVEYWIYACKKSRFTDPRGKTLNTGDTYLSCIIVCEENHIRQENAEFFAINGVKFTEEDMDNYLRKTGRSQ